jgi:transposase-like protein
MPYLNFVEESDTGQTGSPLRAIILVRVFAMSSPVVERPMCPTCKHRMALARISPGDRGFEERTFECATCHRMQKASFPVDPLKTDALGWLASELRPPR